LLVVPLEWVPIVIILIILCYVLQFLGAAAENEDAPARSAQLRKELQRSAMRTQRQPTLSDLLHYHSEVDGQSIFDLSESLSRSSKGYDCRQCKKVFNPIPDKSGISKCPYCGKGHIL